MAVQDELEFIVDTEKAGSATKTIELTLGSQVGADYTVNCNDGEAIFTEQAGAFSYVFDNAGENPIKITQVGTDGQPLEFINAGDKLKVVEHINWGTTCVWDEIFSAFYGCSNMRDYDRVNSPNFDLSAGNNNFFMRSCTSLIVIDMRVFPLEGATLLANFISGATAATGTMFVKIPSTCTGITLSVNANIIAIDYTGSVTTSLTSWNRVHESCGKNAAIIGFNTLDFSVNTNFDRTFFANALNNIDLSNMPNLLVTDMQFMLGDNTEMVTVNFDGFEAPLCANFNGFLRNVTLDIESFSTLIKSLDAGGVQPSQTLDANDSFFYSGGATEAAYDRLIASDLWTILSNGPGIPEPATGPTPEQINRAAYYLGGSPRVE